MTQVSSSVALAFFSPSVAKDLLHITSHTDTIQFQILNADWEQPNQANVSTTPRSKGLVDVASKNAAS